MTESERHFAVVRLWFDLPKAEREGTRAVSRFHSWLVLNRPELLSNAPGGTFFRLKVDLLTMHRFLVTDPRNYKTWGEA